MTAGAEPVASNSQVLRVIATAVLNFDSLHLHARTDGIKLLERCHKSDDDAIRTNNVLRFTALNMSSKWVLQ